MDAAGRDPVTFAVYKVSDDWDNFSGSARQVSCRG
jgi:hypothetical protein